MEEIWKDIPKYEGIYQASSLGRIKRVETRVWNGSTLYERPEHILKPSLINSGRAVVTLCYKSKQKRFLVHRLVALAFLGVPTQKLQVNHKDGNPLNNRLDNLEWCNQSQNEKHKIYVLKKTEGGLIRKPRKVRCVETGEEYASLAEACKITNIKLHILFNRLKTGNSDDYGNHWEYIV